MASRPDADTRRRAERRGRRAELAAALWLRLRGYRLLARRHRGTRGGPMGEIDLIARHGGALVAVEVKARASLEEALDSVTWRQRDRVTRALRHFQARHRALAGLDLRMDLVVVRPWRMPLLLRDIWGRDGF